MKSLGALSWILTLLSVAALGFGEARDKEKKDDTKALDGTWTAETAELAGEKFSEETRKAIKLVLEGGKYTLTISKGADKGTCKVDSSKKPKELDISGTDGPNKGKTYLAIYELDKDTLKVCYDLCGKARPTEFKTKANTQLFLVTYKRSKS